MRFTACSLLIFFYFFIYFFFFFGGGGGGQGGCSRGRCCFSSRSKFYNKDIDAVGSMELFLDFVADARGWLSDAVFA